MKIRYLHALRTTDPPRGKGVHIVAMLLIFQKFSTPTSRDCSTEGSNRSGWPAEQNKIGLLSFEF